MSAYPSPTLHNGSMNTTFNNADFNSTSKLNNTSVNGPLVVNGFATFNNGVSVSGTETITGMANCNGGITTNNKDIYAGTGTITCGSLNCTSETDSGSLTVNGTNALIITNTTATPTSGCIISTTLNGGTTLDCFGSFGGVNNAIKNTLYLNPYLGANQSANNNWYGGVAINKSSITIGVALDVNGAISAGGNNIYGVLVPNNSGGSINGATLNTMIYSSTANHNFNVNGSEVLRIVSTGIGNGANNFNINTGTGTISTNNITLTATSAPTTTGTQLGSTVSGTITATTVFGASPATQTVGSVLLTNAGTYMIYGQAGIQCTTAGVITISAASLNTSAAISASNLTQNSNTAVVGYYPQQVCGVFTVAASTTIYLMSQLTYTSGAYSQNQTYSSLKAVRIA